MNFEEYLHDSQHSIFLFFFANLPMHIILTVKLLIRDHVMAIFMTQKSYTFIAELNVDFQFFCFPVCHGPDSICEPSVDLSYRL